MSSGNISEAIKSSGNALNSVSPGEVLVRGAKWGLLVGASLGFLFTLLLVTFSDSSLGAVGIFKAEILIIPFLSLCGGIVGGFIALLNLAFLGTLKLFNWFSVLIGTSILGLITVLFSVTFGWVSFVTLTATSALFLIQKIYSENLPESSKTSIKNGINSFLTHVTFVVLCLLFHRITGIDIREYIALLNGL